MADNTTSFMRSLCMGQIEQDVLFPFPALSADQKETLREIAGALEANVEAVKKRAQRARLLLMECLHASGEAR